MMLLCGKNPFECKKQNFTVAFLGLIWPTEAMPIGLRIFSKCLPFTLAIESFRNVIKKGWALWDLQVLNGVGVLLGWTLMLGIVSLWLIKLKR